MANYRKVSDETESILDQVIAATSIPNWVEFVALANDDLKELYQVRKLNDLFEFITEGTNIAVIINETIFDELPLDMKMKALEEAVGGIVVDENDKIKLEAFDFTTYSGFLSKYGNDEVIKMKESIQSLFDKKKQKEEEEKAAKKEKKKKK